MLCFALLLHDSNDRAKTTFLMHARKILMFTIYDVHLDGFFNCCEIATYMPCMKKRVPGGSVGLFIFFNQTILRQRRKQRRNIDTTSAASGFADGPAHRRPPLVTARRCSESQTDISTAICCRLFTRIHRCLSMRPVQRRPGAVSYHFLRSVRLSIHRFNCLSTVCRCHRLRPGLYCCPFRPSKTRRFSSQSEKRLSSVAIAVRSRPSFGPIRRGIVTSSAVASVAVIVANSLPMLLRMAWGHP